MPPVIDSVTIRGVCARAYRIPTETCEADGTLSWHDTTLVAVWIDSDAGQGFGYTYGASAVVEVIAQLCAPLLVGRDALATGARRADVVRALRNVGRRGIGATAASAIDIALWDLRGRVFDAPLDVLLGATTSSIAAYGSGGFTNYDDAQLKAQLEQWLAAGLRHVKIKVGRDLQDDVRRVRLARETIGEDVELFVDANGGYTRKDALQFAENVAPFQVRWFEEPVSSDDLEGLRLLRDRAPGGMAIAAGEYGWDSMELKNLLVAGAVDVLQADATRCGGVTGFMAAAALCDSFGVPLSSHCAPSIHVALGCAAPRFVHLEWFYDHVRIEAMLFDGAPTVEGGRLKPNRRPGLGLIFKEQEAACYAL